MTVSSRTGLEIISAVVYSTPQGGTVTLAQSPEGGWAVTDTNTGAEHHFDGIPGFMAFCRANYSWPMPKAVNVS